MCLVHRTDVTIFKMVILKSYSAAQVTQILVRKKRQLHFVTVSASGVSHRLFNGLEAGSYLVKKNTIDIFERLMWSLFPLY